MRSYFIDLSSKESTMICCSLCEIIVGQMQIKLRIHFNKTVHFNQIVQLFSLVHISNEKWHFSTTSEPCFGHFLSNHL